MLHKPCYLVIVKGKEVMGIKGADMHTELSVIKKNDLLSLEHDQRLLAWFSALAKRGHTLKGF